MGRGPDRHGLALQAAVRRVQPRQDSAVRAEKRELPGNAVPGAPGAPGRRIVTAPSPPPPAGALPLPAAPSPSLPSLAYELRHRNGGLQPPLLTSRAVAGTERGARRYFARPRYEM